MSAPAVAIHRVATIGLLGGLVDASGPAASAPHAAKHDWRQFGFDEAKSANDAGPQAGT